MKGLAELPGRTIATAWPVDGIAPEREAGANKGVTTSPPPLNDAEPPKSFFERPGAWLAMFAAGLYSTSVFTLLAHDASLGSFWCPLSMCAVLEAASMPDVLVSQRVFFSALCLFLDVWVIQFHCNNPAHPKFCIRRLRRMSLRIHLASGILQCIIGPVAWVFVALGDYDSVYLIAKVIAAGGFLVHVPTSLYLLTSAFGHVRLMMPGYIHATAMYCYTLGRLVACPHTARIRDELLSYWIVLHVYVFNRIIFGFLTRFNILANVRYTLSILLGLAICVPLALGGMSIVLLIGAVIVFNVVYLLFKETEEHAGNRDVHTCGGVSIKPLVKAHFVAPEGLVVAKAPLGRPRGSHSQIEMARTVFNELDNDGSGSISLLELARLCVSWGLPGTDARQIIKECDTSGDGRLQFEEFYQNLRPVWAFAAAILAENMSTVQTKLK